MLLKVQYQRLKRNTTNLHVNQIPEQNITNKIKQKKYFTLKTEILTINKFFHKH